MDWSAIAAIAAVLALPVAWYVGTRRSKARIYALAPSAPPSPYCRVVIDNSADTPVHVTRATVVWPPGFRLAQQTYQPGSRYWEADAALPLSWGRSVSTSLTVEPGKSSFWEFMVRPSRPAMRISCLMLLHVDETRWMQISRIRVVKVVQTAVTNGQKPPLIIIG